MPEDTQDNSAGAEFTPEVTSSEAEPTTVPVTTAAEPVVVEEKPKSKKKLILAGIASALLVVLFGGGALAYNLWYQNPDKVLADGLAHLITNREDMHTTTVVEASMSEASIKIDADMNIATDAAGGTAKLTLDFGGDMKSLGAMSASADFVVTKDRAYLKMNNIKDTATKVIDAYMDGLAEQYKSYGITTTDKQIEEQKQAIYEQINPILDKIDNRWIKTDLATNDTDDTSCVVEAVTSLTNDKNQQRQVSNIYRDNKFITVKEKLGSKNGSLGYRLGFDEAKAKAFTTAVRDTDFGKAVTKCDDSVLDTSTAMKSQDNLLTNTTFDVWVGRWDHKITRVVASGVSKDAAQDTTFKLDTTLDYKNVTVPTAPTDAIDSDTLSKEIENLFGTSSSTSSASSI